MRRLLATAGALGLLASGCGGGSPRRSPPTNAAARPAPGIVLLVPGSGFVGAPKRIAVAMRLPPAIWHAWGLRTRVAAYRGGATGLADVGAALGAVHRAAPRSPVCLYGESSGGTWALVAAAHDPRVRCVVVAAAPTDQETWARSASRAARSLARRKWPQYFGADPHQDNAFEPYDVWGALHPQIPVLGFYAAGDPIVPAQQGAIFARADPSAQIHVLPRGPRRFIHSSVATAALKREAAEVRRFVLRYDSR